SAGGAICEPAARAHPVGRPHTGWMTPARNRTSRSPAAEHPPISLTRSLLSFLKRAEASRPRELRVRVWPPERKEMTHMTHLRSLLRRTGAAALVVGLAVALPLVFAAAASAQTTDCPAGGPGAPGGDAGRSVAGNGGLAFTVGGF